MSVRRLLPLAAWLGALAATAAAMTLLGSGPLAAPPADPAAWAGWAADRGPAAAALAVVRLAVLALALYLLVVSSAAAAAGAVRGRPPLDLAGLLVLPALRHAVWTAVGLGVVGGAVAAAASGAPRPVPALPAAADGQLAEPPATDAPVVRSLARTPTPSGADVPTTTVLPEPAPSPEVTAPPATTPAAARAPSPATHVVAPGQHLWSIAEGALAGAADRPPSEREVARYWRRLVEANRHALRDPANPDLVFPGDRLVLPVPSER